MRREVSILILIPVSIGLGLLAAGKDNNAADASKPDLSGRWELNTSKSAFGKMPIPTRMTLEASRKGDALHSVQTSYDQAGGPDAVEGDWYLDGKERSIGSQGKMSGWSRWDGNVLVSERKSKDGSYREEIRLTVSQDGKTATEQVKTRTPNGSNESKLVWERR